MRRYFVFICFMILCNNLFGQVRLRINFVLEQVQHITVNNGQTALSLVYSSLEDYQKGVEVIKRAQISVFSTAAFEVKVRLAYEDFTMLRNTETPKVKLPNVQVKANSTNTGDPVSLQAVLLNTTANTIISSSSPILGSDFDISYKGPGANELIKYVGKETKTEFTNDILFSIEAR